MKQYLVRPPGQPFLSSSSSSSALVLEPVLDTPPVEFHQFFMKSALLFVLQVIGMFAIPAPKAAPRRAAGLMLFTVTMASRLLRKVYKRAAGTFRHRRNSRKLLLKDSKPKSLSICLASLPSDVRRHGGHAFPIKGVRIYPAR